MIDPEFPFARVLLCVVLAGLLTLLIVRAVRKDRRQYRRFKRFHSTVKRQRMYRKWLIDSAVTFGGASVVLLLLVWQYVPLLLAAIDGYGWVRAFRAGFAASGGVGVAVVVSLMLALVVGGVLGIVLARKVDTVPAIGDIQALLPRNRAELRYGAALSINAGIVEELLFRLAVPALVFGITGSGAVAVAVSLLLFGALHIYQGVAGVIGSTIIGTLLMTLFLATGSILVAIVAHALIDLRSLVLIPVVVNKVHRLPGRADVRRQPAHRAVDPSPPL
jgi:membrane protease YdiL (CAAX protease family)